MGILVQGTVLTFPRTSNSSNKCNATSAICPLLHAVMQAFHVTSKKTKTQIIKMSCPESFRIWYKVYIQMQYIHITSVDMNNFLMMWFALHAAFTFMPPWLFIEVRGHPAFVSTHFQRKLFQPSWQNNKNNLFAKKQHLVILLVAACVATIPKHVAISVVSCRHWWSC